MHSCTSWTSQKIMKYTVFLLYIAFFFHWWSNVAVNIFSAIIHLFWSCFLTDFLNCTWFLSMCRDILARFGSGASMEVQESCGRTWPATQDLFLVLLNRLGIRCRTYPFCWSCTDNWTSLQQQPYESYYSSANIIWLYICCLPKCPCMIVCRHHPTI